MCTQSEKSKVQREIVRIPQHTALLVVDMQMDFLEGGALGVPGSLKTILPITDLIKRHDWSSVIFTQDWHPNGHVSFASSHSNKKPFADSIKTFYGEQELWPDHCIQQDWGATLYPQLPLHRADLILRKGTKVNLDSYSAVFENDKRTNTGLLGYLQSREICLVVVVGLAFDFCVGFTALDLGDYGLDVIVPMDCTAAVSEDGKQKMIDKLDKYDSISIIEKYEDMFLEK